jgi:hypothetical protein
MDGCPKFFVHKISKGKISMSGTHVFYNGVELRDCTTKRFSQQMKMDDSGNHLTSKFVIAVESLAYGFLQSQNSPGGDSLGGHPSTIATKYTDTTDNRITATDRVGIIQRLLKEPRKDFFFATHSGRREDVGTDDVYQILLAATGADKAGKDDAREYFKDINGDDLRIKYLRGFNEDTSTDTRIPRHNVVDTNKGPTPLDVTVTELYGGRAFKISFTIEVHRHLCLNQDPESDPDSKPYNLDTLDNAKANPYVISNTWSSEETCDELFRRTRAIDGTLRVRDERYWAQAFRYLCIPALLPGYRRMSQRFASDATNLVLKYSIQDKQAEAAPPAPAIDWVMKHTDSSKNEYGMVERQLYIKLTGLPKTPKEHLLAGAIRLLDLRFPGARRHAADFKKMRAVPISVTGMIVTQANNDPAIELMCNIRQHLAGIGGFEQAVEKSTKPLAFAGYDPDNWPAPLPFDSKKPAGIFACYAQRPCSQWHGMPQWQELDLDKYQTKNDLPNIPENEHYWDEGLYEEYRSSKLMSELKEDEVVSNVHRVDAIANAYTLIEVETEYSNDVGKMVLPLSGPRDVNGKTQTSVVIPIHAGVMTREIRGIREGAPVELPDPAPTLVDQNGVTEQLIGTAKLLLEAPTIHSSQQFRVFSAQMKLKYALERPLATNERYRMANNIALGTEPQDNSVSGLALFSKGRIEYHAIPTGTSPGDYPAVLVVAPTINNETVGRTVD